MAAGISKFIDQGHRRRKVVDACFRSMLTLAACLALMPLFSILAYIVSQGAPALGWSFFTELPKPVGEEGGGMANALAGTGVLIFIASAIGVPWGVGLGVYLSEYGRGGWPKTVRFCADLLSSVPSIIVGLFVYSVIVVATKHFSAYAGGIALSIIMIPTIARTTEELLRMVPAHIREAGLALGLSRWRVILFIVLKGSRKGIITAIMLAIARVSGETAPLLFTAFNNRFWSTSLNQPISSLPVQIYTYAISPFDDWHRQAWAGAFVLVLFVFAVSAVTRLVTTGPKRATT